MREWHKILIVILAPVAAYFAVAYFVVPSLFPPFFYADYNRARESLERIPGVQIIDDWQHHDISLEDCGFTVKIGSSEPVGIDFYEGENWKTRFWQLDGVVMSFPYNQATNDYEATYLNAKDFETIGIKLESLSDVLQNIEEVLRLTRSRPHSSKRPPIAGEWCNIFYDLDRYKEDQQDAGGKRDVAPPDSRYSGSVDSSPQQL